MWTNTQQPLPLPIRYLLSLSRVPLYSIAGPLRPPRRRQHRRCRGPEAHRAAKARRAFAVNEFQRGHWRTLAIRLCSTGCGRDDITVSSGVVTRARAGAMAGRPCAHRPKPLRNLARLATGLTQSSVLLSKRETVAYGSISRAIDRSWFSSRPQRRALCVRWGCRCPTAANGVARRASTSTRTLVFGP